MLKIKSLVGVILVVVSSPCLASAGDIVLDANGAATGASAWFAKKAIQLDYSYVGQGLSGSNTSIVNLTRDAFVDSYDIAPTKGANGYDGVRAWELEPSGLATDQAGGDILKLAKTEAYVGRNVWWQPGRGGAEINSDGQRSEGARFFDVVTIIPRDGKSVTAWFDSNTHLLDRTVEKQGTVTITTSFSDYAAVDGIMIAHKQVIDDGSGLGGRQTLTLVTAQFSGTRPASSYEKPIAHLADHHIRGASGETTIPFNLINNHIYADVSVNGAAPLPFMFDTGGHDLLTPTGASVLQVKPIGALPSTGTGTEVAIGGLASVRSISIGGATIENQPVTVLQFLKPQVEGITAGGMIGLEFFARFVTRIDYGTRTITFIDKARFDPRTAGTAVPMTLYHQLPEVSGSFDGVPGRFAIDTGSRMTLQLNGPFAARGNIKAMAPRGAEALTGWGVGGSSRGYVFRGGKLKFGAITVQDPLTVISTDKGGAGGSEDFPNNLGGGLLKRFVITLDYDHGTAYFKPLRRPAPDLDEFDKSGMWINQSDVGARIADLTENGPAEGAGLLKGDDIIAIDGVSIATLSLSDVRGRLRTSRPGTEVHLLVQRQGVTKSVTLVLRDII